MSIKKLASLSQYDYPFKVSPDRADTDRFTVDFLGQSVQTGSSWNLPYILYSDLLTNMKALPTSAQRTYSLANAYGSAPRAQAGLFAPIQTVIGWVLPNIVNIPNITTFAAFCAQTSLARITINSGGFEIGILGSQIRDTERRFYSSTGVPGTDLLQFGLLYYEDDVEDDEGNVVGKVDVIRFVIGQLKANDVNSNMCVVCADGGATISFSMAASLPQWNDFRVFIKAANGTEVAYTPQQTIPNTPPTSTLRFGIDQNDLLNGARLYYTVSDDIDDPPATPSPTETTADIYNMPPPQFSANGASYPVVYSLTASREYNILIRAYGPGAVDSAIMQFRFTTTA